MTIPAPPCIHFLPDGPAPLCIIGRPRAECGIQCSAYIIDAERTACEVWSRVMGYHRPVSAYNAGKQQEHRDRRYFRQEAKP